jgi:two-component system cell cycle sensor histidine kinase/response regulator CckA
MTRDARQDWQAGAAAMLAAWPGPAALLDRRGRLQGVNAAALALLGAARPGRMGDDARLWFSLAEQPAFLAALSTGSGQLALCLEDPLAAPRMVEVVLKPLERGLILLQMRAEAPQGREERLALLGRMAGGVAHDFNNLLSIVMGASRAASQAPDAGARALELAAIDAAAERGAGLVRQLLAFSRQQVLAPRILALNDSVAAIGAILPRLLGPGIALDLALDEPGRLVLADPTQLDQIILNLVANARDAIRGSGKGARIRLATGRRVVLQTGGEDGIPPGRYASIIVEDDGPGIPPALMSKIFEPFFTTRIDKGGTGLGLATVQGIVAQSGGHILAESVQGDGTRFTILLPRQQGEAPAAGTETTPAAASHATILLAEDEPALLRLSSNALAESGHTVLPAEDAYTAIELIEAGARPDLLISDVSMPGMDGVALARAARVLCPGLPVLLLSGYAAATLAVDMAAEGWHFLAKPCRAEALHAAVAAALAKSA